MIQTTGFCKGFRADRDTDPCQNCGSDYGRHGGPIATWTLAGTEYTVMFDGAPVGIATFTDPDAAQSYIEGGVAMGNDRSRYGIAKRGTVSVTTDWTVL